MSRKKLFIENVFAYGFMNVLNKAVPFLLLPTLTRLLPDASDFGVYSMYTTIVGFGTPLAILGLYDAMFREYFESDNIQYRYNVTTTAQRIVMYTSFFIGVFLVIFSNFFSNLFFGDQNHGTIVILAGLGVFIGGIESPIKAPTKIQNQRKVFTISGVISSLSIYILAIVLINYGFSYYGMIYASIVVGSLICIYFWKRNNAFFVKGAFDKSIAKELLKIGLPLLPTFLIYWLFKSMDNVMITNLLGTQELGVYSIGLKVAQISQLIYTAFTGGWQYFVFSTMKDKDQVELNSKIFEYLGGITILSLIIMYPLSPYIFQFLFSGDYVNGYIVMPYLYVSPLILMLFQIVANQFLVIKKSYLVTLSLCIGAVTNVVLNYILIQSIGIEGAAIATLSGYIITILIVMLVSSKINCMNYSFRIITLMIMIPVYFFTQRILFFDSIIFQIVNMITFSLVILFAYKDELTQVIRKTNY